MAPHVCLVVASDRRAQQQSQRSPRQPSTPSLAATRDAVVRAATELAPAFGGAHVSPHTKYVRELASQTTQSSLSFDGGVPSLSILTPTDRRSDPPDIYVAGFTGNNRLLPAIAVRDPRGIDRGRRSFAPRQSTKQADLQ